MPKLAILGSVIDREEFNRFRRAAVDALNALYSILKDRALHSLASILPDGSQAWHLYEAVLFVVQSLGETLMETLVSMRTKRMNSTDIAQSLSRTLRHWFSTSMQLLATNPQGAGELQLRLMIVNASASVARWLNTQEDMLLPLVGLHFSLCTADADSGVVAAKAFRQLAREAKGALALHAEALARDLMQGQMVQQGKECRGILMEGLSYILSELPAVQVKPIIEGIGAHLMSRVQQLLLLGTQHASNSIACQAIITELHSLGGLVRLLAAPADPSVVPVVDLLRACWPTLASALSAAVLNEEIVDVFCEMLERFFTSARVALKSLIAPILENLVGCFQRLRSPSCLILFAHAVEMFYDGETHDIFGTVVAIVSESALGELMHNMATSQALAAAFFDLLHRFSIFAPALLGATPSLASSLQAAVRCIGLVEDKDSVRSAMAFVQTALASKDMTLATARHHSLVVGELGPHLLMATLQSLYRPTLADCNAKAALLAHEIFMAFPESSIWLASCLASPSFRTDAAAINSAVAGLASPSEPLERRIWEFSKTVTALQNR